MAACPIKAEFVYQELIPYMTQAFLPPPSPIAFFVELVLEVVGIWALLR